MLLIRLIFFCSLVLGAGIARAETITIAVAANAASVMKPLIARFEQKSGHKVVMAVGASGKFVAQIRAGAPFDLFFSADQVKPQALIASGHAIAASRITYANGALVLWSANALAQPVEQRLKNGSFGRLAIANARLAPYGLAAQQAIAALGLTDSVANKLVQGENIAQTYQFVATANAELGIVAASQVLAPGEEKEGDYWLLPGSLYSPIKQDAVMLRSARDKAAANAFLRFICTQEAQEIFARYAYTTTSCMAADALIQ